MSALIPIPKIPITIRPGTMEAWGLDYDTLTADNPGLVMVRVSGFGQSGPYAKRPGVDQIAQGMGGLMSITGLPGQGPVRVGIPIDDLCAGLLLAQAILMALIEREQSGEGQWVHTSLLEAQIFMLDFQASRWLIAGEVAKQAGNDHPTGIPDDSSVRPGTPPAARTSAGARSPPTPGRPGRHRPRRNRCVRP